MLMFAYAGPWQTHPPTRHNRYAKIMSVLITLLVVGLVIVYLRGNRKARVKWLQNLSLPVIEFLNVMERTCLWQVVSMLVVTRQGTR